MNYAFIIGAQRSGTTFLAKLLQDEHEIEFAKPISPEPKFFINEVEYQKGIPFYKKSFFSKRSGVSLRVDKSTSYMEHTIASKRISKHFPDAHIIAVLRNPIDRAVSNYFFTKANGLESLSLEEALDREDSRLRLKNTRHISVSPYAYKSRGKYINYLKIWRDRFPNENIHLLFFEEITDSPDSIAALLSDLGLPREISELQKPENIGLYPDGFSIPKNLVDKLRQEFLPSVHSLDHEFGTHAKSLWGFADE